MKLTSCFDLIPFSFLEVFSCIERKMEGGASSGGRFKLYDHLELQEFQDKFVIKAVESPDQGFSIDRRDGHTRPLNGT